MDHLLQYAGALLILLAFVLAQLGILNQTSWAYLWTNLVGAAALAVDAWFGRQRGFFVLEGVWALVSLGSIAARARRPGAR